MRAFLLTILAALLTSGAVGRLYSEVDFTHKSRGLLDIPSIEDVRTSCKTSASATVFVEEGSATVRSRSSCAAFAASIDDIEEVVNDYVKKVEDNPEKKCTKVEIDEVISACAQAIAKVYTEASVDIEVLGDAEACGEASSEGDAYAKAYSALMINLWLGVTTGENSAEAEANVGTLTFALSKAWAAAKLSKCQIGTGSVQEFESSYAEQVRIALSCVTVELAAKLCNAAFAGEVEGGPCDTCGGGELESYLDETESVSEVGVCSSTYNLVNETDGNAAIEDREIRTCKNDRDECCDEFYNGKSECLCGQDCFLRRTVSGVWLDSSDNTLCHCPNYEALPFDDPNEEDDKDGDGK